MQHGVAHLDRMAAHFAVLDIGLPLDGGVQHHGYLLKAVGAREEILHSDQDNGSARLAFLSRCLEDAVPWRDAKQNQGAEKHEAERVVFRNGRRTFGVDQECCAESDSQQG